MKLIFITFIVFVSCAVVHSVSNMQPFIVGGYKAKIVDFPYSIHFNIIEENIGSWVCGGSIINQYLTLTAAHCLYPCTKASSISVSYGHENILKCLLTTVHTFAIHQRYSDDSLSNDIAMARLNTQLEFNSRVSRVVLMENPPYKEEARVAGWGVTDEKRKVRTTVLKYTKQYVWTRKKCLKQLQELPKGSICAKDKVKRNYAAVGDSGSALVVRGYIQIGIVSHKYPINGSIIIYTSTGYFYKWIRSTANKMMCP